MTELTEVERELLKELCRDRTPRRHGEQKTLESLKARGLSCMFVYGDGDYWTITDAGREALIEAKVSEQFADLDRLTNIDGPDSPLAMVYLSKIVRDHARRIAELEARQC